MALYLRIDDIQGSVTTTGYQGCIDIFSYTLKSMRTITKQSAIGADRTIGALKFYSLIINKSVDGSTIALLQHMYDTTVIPEITISNVTTGATPQCYATNTFH